VRMMVLAILAGFTLSAASVSAQSSPGAPAELDVIKADLERIKSDLEDVKRQLGQILRLVQPRSAQAPAAAPPSRVRASVADAPMLGRPDAPVTLVEFSDYQCPFCQQFFLATLPALKRDYIDTGKVRYVFRDYPLDQIHPQARKAAEAAHCAGDQGKYWEMHDLLFRNQRALALPQLGEHARALGLETNAFDACLTSGKHAERVGKGLGDGLAAGIQGTPGFVVGKTEPGSSVEGASVRGAQPVDAFRRLIDQLLADK
jgi:protein-disulfide isomerase